MRAILIPVAAVTLGLAGGYAWSTLSAPAVHKAAPPRGTIQRLPASPEERPAVLDEEWTRQAEDGPVASPPAQDRSVTYSGCNEVRAAGRAPLYEGQPGYSEKMDGDGDRIACEPHRRG
jgi:hypothetical protein